MGIDLRLSGGYPLRHLDRLLGAVDPLLRLKEPAVVKIDLSGLVFLSPVNLAVLTAAFSRLIESALWEQGTELIYPRSRAVKRYLQRMDVIRHFAGEIEEDFERRPPVGFRACQRFTGDDCHVASRELTAAVAERVPADALGRNSLYVCLDELAENVVHHARSQVGGFAAAQGWEKRGEVEIAIVDLGIGIRGSLRKNPQYADIRDDVEAIQKATEPDVTSRPGRNTGWGLAITKLLLADNGGTLMLRSGRGAVYTGSVRKEETRQTAFPGTIVALTIRTDRALDINAVYRQLGFVGDDV